MNTYRKFWQAGSMTEAWLKIVTGTKENYADTEATSGLLLEGVPDGGHALEIGAGVGRLMRFMSPHFKTVSGVDVSEDMITLSKDFLKGYSNCGVRLSDGYVLPFASGSLDFVYSYITFQHMPDLCCVRSNIAEIYRVLRPGGVCRVQTIKGVPFKGEPGTGGFHGYYFDNETDFLSEFKQQGLHATVRTTRITDAISVIWITGRKENA